MATQTLIEYERTFPLPEAQLDRFLMRINLGYPSRGDEITILASQLLAHPIDEIGEVIIQSAIYSGIPAANTAFRIAGTVFAETDGKRP
jgi:MoxR-like ATPase